MPKKGSEITVQMSTAAYEGKCVGKLDGMAVFVGNTAPGDVVRAQIIRKKSSFAEGRLLEILEEGPDRIEPKCQHASYCGGCSWQHVSYDEQARFKRIHVRDHIHRIGKLTQVDPLPTLTSERQFHYRNKMEYTFSDMRWLTPEEIASGDDFNRKGVALGLHVPGRYDKILDLKECYLQDAVSFELLDWLRKYAVENGIEPWNTHQRTGFLRNLMIRNAFHTEDLMVNLVTYADDSEFMEKFTSDLLSAFPMVTTVINNINDTFSPTSIGRYEKVYHGPGYITEYIGAYSFHINANAFFQTNTQQAEALYETARQFADLKEGDIVYDLYCGVGSLSLYVSEKATKVIGIEINETSIKNAEANRDRNGVNHCYFEQGDMKDVFTKAIIEKHGRPDVIITDPPRAGMHEDVVRHLNEIAVDRLVYVSCNSATMARDLEILSEVYDVIAIQPVDMFPQTYHIESVASLRLKK
jgi:23S rRNA (uracil1939-C5)-methyltransferase